MKISNISDIEVKVIKNIFTMSKYILLKLDNSKLYFPIFRPEVIYSDRLIIMDELGFREEYPNSFEVFIGESIVLINSPDCSRFDIYYSIYKLEEIEKSYREILERRVIKSIFSQEVDLSEYTEQSTGFIIELLNRFRELELTKESVERKSINIFINKTKVEIGFDIWNLDNYLNLVEELEYSLRLKISDFNLEVEANSLNYLMMRLYDELEIRGVRKW